MPFKPLYIRYLAGGGRWVAGGSKASPTPNPSPQGGERQRDGMAMHPLNIVFSIGKHRFLRKKTVFSLW